MSNPTLVELVDSLCDALSRRSHPAMVIASQLGEIQEQGTTAIYVTPSHPNARRVIVTHERGADATSYIEFELAAAGSVGIGELEQRYGRYSEPPMLRWDAPLKAIFAVDRGAERPFTCKVIAAVEGADVPTGKVVSLALLVEAR